MINRFVIDLGDERNNEAINVKYWKYFYVGSCDGDVSLRLNNPRADDLNPNEFNKIDDLNGVYLLYITNTAQAGKELVLYYEEEKGRWYL